MFQPYALSRGSRRRTGATVVHLEGELDLAAVPKLQEALHSAQHADVSQIVVDLRGLTFLDSTGLGVLLAADIAGRDGHVAVSFVRANETVHRVPAHRGGKALELGRRARLANSIPGHAVTQSGTS